MNPKLFQLLGLAMRAGKIVSGEERVILAIRKQQVYVVVLTEDAAQNTSKKVMDKAKTFGIPLVMVESREELGRAIGKEQRVVVGVTDIGFSKQMKKINGT